jgi:purine-cytosine permease-like protein
LLAFSTVAHANPTQEGMFAAFIAVPVGWLAFGMLVLRELDESFANVYSTAVSVQNLRPLADRRILAVGVGVVATALALLIDIASYQNFLYLIGSVFVPMFAVFVTQYFVYGGGKTWSTSERAPSRVALLVPWVLGFISYQMINPGGVGWWADFWSTVDRWLRFSPPDWLSASLSAFAVAFVVSLFFRPVSR